VLQSNTAAVRALNPDSINSLVQQAVARTGFEPARYSAHSLYVCVQQA
jgi:hypothetical protein